MPIPVTMPQQGNSVVECLLVEWNVREGDRVGAGQTLCHIETDKASFEVPSPADGVVLRLFRQAGDLVPVLTNIAALGEPGEDASALAPADSAAPATADAAAGAAATAAAAAAAAAAPMTDTPAASHELPAHAVGGGAPPPVSPRAKRLAETLHVRLDSIREGTGPGGRIVSGDVRAAASLPGGRMTPAAHDLAAAGHTASGATGPGGWIRASDMGIGAPGDQLPPGAPPAAAAPVAAPINETSPSPPAAIPHRGIRKLIAERMRHSMVAHAQLTLHRRADATALLALRAWAKARSAKDGVPAPTLNDLICWVIARTLPGFPELNGTFELAAERFLQYTQAHLAVAVDTPRGLMVPVIRDAHLLSPAALALAVADAAAACRKGSIDPERLQGGTFTVSNLGAMGIEQFTPILNSPQVAILGVGAVTETAVPDGQGGQSGQGGLRWQPQINLSLTIDHQVVDGAPGARFLQAVAAGLADLDKTLALRGLSGSDA